jgi:exodeoxyribonuclease V alpha subunit
MKFHETMATSAARPENALSARPEISYFLADLFPEAAPELLQLFESATENAALLRSDYYTIRDWLEISDYREHPCLPALLLVLLLALEEGSFCLELSEAALARRLSDLIDSTEAAQWAQRLLADLERAPCPRLIGTSAGEHKPLILHTAGERRFLYFQRYLKEELLLHDQLRSRLEQPPPLLDVERLGLSLRDVLITIPSLLSNGQPLELDREQQWALGAALARPLALISGGPGTGKTSLVLTLLRCLVRSGYAPERIALAAPTGRAAQRLGDAVRLGLGQLAGSQEENSADGSLRAVAVSTLHQLLGYRLHRNLFTRHPENPIAADVVVVDEVSMVGLVLMAQLFQALAPGTKLILLGDKDQLPSVDAGAVLASLVPEHSETTFDSAVSKQLAAAWPQVVWPRSDSAGKLQEHVVVLQTNHRSQAEIRAAAAAINGGAADCVDRLPLLQFPPAAELPAWWADLEGQGGCWLLPQSLESASELRGFLQHWLEQAYFRSRFEGATFAELLDGAEQAAEQERLRQLFTLLERFRLLTLVREGAWGCVDINRFCDHYLRPRLDADSRAALFAGAPVLIVRNDATHGLYNGDVGIALRCDGNLRVFFQRENGFVSFPAEALPAHELGFALTVHKSQGSEYAHALVVLPPQGGRRLLTRELLYTAVTRAKKLAVLCGTKEVLRLAIERRVVRESGLLRLLR